jgi:hypothetical protein
MIPLKQSSHYAPFFFIDSHLYEILTDAELTATMGRKPINERGRAVFGHHQVPRSQRRDLLLGFRPQRSSNHPYADDAILATIDALVEIEVTEGFQSAADSEKNEIVSTT